MSKDDVAICRCGHLWTVHLEGNCDGAEGSCDCRGFYHAGWRRNTTDTCRRCHHGRSQHSGVRCEASIGQDTVTHRHFGSEGDSWTTKGTVDIPCPCQSFY
ncbi:hypothetical protein ACWGLE_04435 [Streptomyces sp. NPDC055897]